MELLVSVVHICEWWDISSWQAVWCNGGPALVLVSLRCHAAARAGHRARSRLQVSMIRGHPDPYCFPGSGSVLFPWIRIRTFSLDPDPYYFPGSGSVSISNDTVLFWAVAVHRERFQSYLTFSVDLLYLYTRRTGTRSPCFKFNQPLAINGTVEDFAFAIEEA